MEIGWIVIHCMWDSAGYTRCDPRSARHTQSWAHTILSANPCLATWRILQVWISQLGPATSLHIMNISQLCGFLCLRQPLWGCLQNIDTMCWTACPKLSQHLGSFQNNLICKTASWMLVLMGLNAGKLVLKYKPHHQYQCISVSHTRLQENVCSVSPIYLPVMLVLISNWQSSPQWLTRANAKRCRWWSEKTTDCIIILNGLVLGCWALQFCSFLTCHGLLTWSHCSLVMFRVAPSPPLSTATPFFRITAAHLSTVLYFNKPWIKGGQWCAWWGGDSLPRRIRLCSWSSFVFLCL